jgi:hypothetical protein
MVTGPRLVSVSIYSSPGLTRRCDQNFTIFSNVPTLPVPDMRVVGEARDGRRALELLFVWRARTADINM